MEQLKQHPLWEDWMIHWVFDDGVKYTGYAPDDTVIATGTNATEFLNDFLNGVQKWEEDTQWK